MLGTWLYDSGGTNLDSVVYTYNAGNQRTQVTRNGENTAGYAYDAIGEVIADQAYENGGPSRLNEQLHYGFDPAGNLVYRTNNALVQNFQINSLNELTANTNGGTLTVMGATSSDATVTVNGASAATYNDNTFAAANMPFATNYTAVASDGYGQRATNTVTVNLATQTAFQYDGNGNLTNDGLHNFAYDDENQLTQVWVSNQWMSQFAYDGKMRRRIRQEYAWQNGAWAQTSEVYYVYDGNVVIQERNQTSGPTATYTRGKDFGGSLEGAGGIGGLLSMTLNTNSGPLSANSMFYHCDGNGNVKVLTDPSQDIVAKYFYDAFGNVIGSYGPLAAVNLYRFSSKEAHPPSGLVYYLYRYYDPNLQRWLNRDPIGEEGREAVKETIQNFHYLNVPSDGDFRWNGRAVLAPAQNLLVPSSRLIRLPDGTSIRRLKFSKAEMLPEGPNSYSFVANEPVTHYDPDGLMLVPCPPAWIAFCFVHCCPRMPIPICQVWTVGDEIHVRLNCQCGKKW